MAAPAPEPPPDLASQLALLHAAPGPKGSGRQRYGAAMFLRHRGLICDTALEVFRICSARDGEDPSILLAQRGVTTLPPPGPSAAELRIRTLIAECDRYLAGFPATTDGIGETRAGIARWRDGPCTAEPTQNPIVESHLPAALSELSQTHPALATAISDAAPDLRWITYDAYPAEIGPVFPHAHAFAQVIGTPAAIPAEDFDFGLFLIAPHVFYRDHHHAAPELYAPLTGPHGWRFRPGAPLVSRPAHRPVWNPPDQPHATMVGAVPFLCLYAWTRNADSPAHLIPANDWDRIEARPANQPAS